MDGEDGQGGAQDGRRSERQPSLHVWPVADAGCSDQFSSSDRANNLRLCGARGVRADRDFAFVRDFVGVDDHGRTGLDISSPYKNGFGCEASSTMPCAATRAFQVYYLKANGQQPKAKSLLRGTIPANIFYHGIPPA